MAYVPASLRALPGCGDGAVAVARHAARTGRSGPAMTGKDIAVYLQAHGMPAFGELLLAEFD
jgi:hypothetical protein